MRRALILIVPLAALAGAAACTVGPNYKRPETKPPQAFRDVAAPAAGASIGETRWSEVFQDEQLQGLIKTGLAQNFDVRIAATRILQAEAQLGITRSAQFPQVSAGVGAAGQRTRQAGVNNGNPVTFGAGQVQGNLSWELDFWGKFRRATEASQAQLLATQWGQRAVVTTLVGQIASAYFDLRGLDLQLEITKRTLASRQESLRLTQVRERGGATSLVDVRQAEQLVYTATSEIAQLEREIAQQENFISVLLGNDPGAVTRGKALAEQPHSADVPAGLPSALLERRPDIQQAEQLLIAANANIGVARAAYFPQITLTGNGGFQSTALSALFTGASAVWTVGAALAQPVFTAGRTRSQVALAEAREQELVLTYQQSIKATTTRASSASSKGCWSARRRTPAAWRNCATKAAPPATSKCSTPIRACSPPNWASPRPRPASSPRWSKSTAPSAAAGSRSGTSGTGTCRSTIGRSRPDSAPAPSDFQPAQNVLSASDRLRQCHQPADRPRLGPTP
jgi:multidrug efflux system outer membrane protein